jgi:hypothetical protein
MQRDLPDDLKPDVPLDLQGALAALRFQLERMQETLRRLRDALEES